MEAEIYISIVEDTLIVLRKQKEKRIFELLQQGGCPANNVRCVYLRNGICILPNPRIDLVDYKCVGCWDANIY